MKLYSNTDLRLVRNGDEKAFERLYLRFWAKVYHFTALYIRDEFEREEIVQNVFIRLWRMRERLDPDKEPDGLLFIITRNLVFNQKHRSVNETAVMEALAMDTALIDEAAYSPEHGENSSRLENLVEALPPRQKETFRLYHEGGLSYKEISTKLGISEKGVERNLYLARKFLRQNLHLFLLFMGVADSASFFLKN